MKTISIKGAREHNLKNIDVELPRDKLVVITGLSGSGKSSLAFDTIYAEGQRRYVESLSAYARQFLELMSKPDVDSIEGLSPAISIEQKTTSRNPRSTVGTITEIYDYLRLLYARIGHVHCYQCAKLIQSQTVQQMCDTILAWPEGTKLHILAPIIRGRKGEYQKEFQNLAKQGFVRVKVDGEVHELPSEIKLAKTKKHDIDVFVDRLVLKESIRKRLAESLETALNLAGGLVKVERLEKSGEVIQLFSENFACIECGISYPEISPRMFSFNNPHGACQTCSGLGTKTYFDPGLVVPNTGLSIREGAIVPWSRKKSVFFHNMLEALSEHYDFDINTAFHDLPQKVQDALLYGSGKEKIRFFYERGRRKKFYNSKFEGILPKLERQYHETQSDKEREDLENFMNIQPCPGCDGARLRKESLFIKVGNKSIHEITNMSIQHCEQFMKKVTLSAREQQIARRILKEIRERLHFLVHVGLEYLALNRSAGTLSGGEAQRIRLANQIGSSLVGVLYILDEPSIGLHQRDNERLLQTLERLRDIGNTVVVVEHDEQAVMSADYVVDMGPKAGVHGGEVVFAGPPQKILKHPKSLTGQYLSGRKSIPIPLQRREVDAKRMLTIVGAQENNLKQVTVDIPLSCFVCVTGVSGSGKSTLIIDTLFKALMQHLHGSKYPSGKVKGIKGLQHIDKVIDIDQSPIGRTPRSNPATYTGVFTYIRELFAKLPDSKVRGYKPGRYSFNVKGGRCEACQGDGVIKIEMHFLPDVYVTCEECQGKRFNRETLEIMYRGKNIADVLEMTINTALEFFDKIPSIRQKLQTLKDVGLGYIALGQAATTLSGGEAQRIKLAKELSKRSTGKTFYILDEPTTGLHFHDIRKLLDVLNRLVEGGNTVLVIEHNLDVIKTADYIIDLGPEGGDKGGKIIATGTPEEVVKVKTSYTGKFLKPYLSLKKLASVA